MTAAVRRSTLGAAVFALVALAALGMGLHAHDASGQAMPASAPAAVEPAPAARPAWAQGGFRDGETWRQTSPSPDTN
jgi:hypothetical protein